eukprot:CAMPEP_0178953578 /NCGR_PEP_ID=MMETSP0789-20121207/8496_1 /TAXON_ID=3005 /ORGANISM="Rhizosolenia setigera, Strain CCMP 1694" /LENGTH=153 /DNA_ID=CAMNT_0020634851 /DNA_START=175 /DNA_END=636 /DNA_ORIENTATION=-
MVIATELCALSEYRIYPGNGQLMIRRDSKPVWLGSSKAKSLTLQRKKPAKLVWTQAWRRLHKKGLTEITTKKTRRRTTKIARAIVGISLEDIRKKASQKPEFRSAQRSAALKEAKAKAAAAKKERKAAGYNNSANKAKATKQFANKGKRGTQR